MMVANEGDSETWPAIIFITGVIIFLAGLCLDTYKLYYWLRYGEWVNQFVWQKVPWVAKWIYSWESWLGLKKLMLWTLGSDLAGFAMTLGGLFILIRFLIWD